MLLGDSERKGFSSLSSSSPLSMIAEEEERPTLAFDPATAAPLVWLRMSARIWRDEEGDANPARSVERLCETDVEGDPIGEDAPPEDWLRSLLPNSLWYIVGT